MRDEVLLSLIEKRGATKRIAVACGVTTQAVSQWKRVPRRHVQTVAELFALEPTKLAPEQRSAA